MSKIIVCGVTQGQIDAWKREFKEVHLITVKDGENEINGIFRKPDMTILSAAGRVAKSDPMQSGQIMFDNCLLACDDALKTDDELKVSCFSKLGELFKIREASIKKL